MECIIDFYVDFAMCFILLLKYRVGGMRMNWGAVKLRYIWVIDNTNLFDTTLIGVQKTNETTKWDVFC